MNVYSMTDDAIAMELGTRLQRQRLNRNVSQEQLASEIGVSKPTIIQLEKGQGKLITLIAAMRALGMLDQVNAIVPDVAASPIQMAKMRGQVRQRASAPGAYHVMKERQSPQKAGLEKVVHNKSKPKGGEGW